MSEDASPYLKLRGHPANREVIAYLESRRPSAHSDIATELLDAAAHISVASSFCPDPTGYAYEALYLPNGVIYALAVGMGTLIFRLPEPPQSAGTNQRGKVFDEISRDWWAVEMFRGGDVDRDREMARRLCSSAYRQATSLCL
jgi:hypothetical protein